jgi:hypothetical protein
LPQEWYDLSLELEDEILPLIEKESKGPSPRKPRDTTAALPRRKTLLQKAAESRATATATSSSSSSSSGAMSQCPVTVTTSGGSSKTAADADLPEIQVLILYTEDSSINSSSIGS